MSSSGEAQPPRRDIEAVLLDHPEVIEAGVVGVPHQVLGEDVAAVVVLATSSTLTPDELRAFLAERLADYKVPRRIEMRSELPRTPPARS